MNRKRYMISWKYRDTAGKDHWGRDVWAMKRRGKMSPNDILQLEQAIADKWGCAQSVLITNIVEIN